MYECKERNSHFTGSIIKKTLLLSNYDNNYYQNVKILTKETKEKVDIFFLGGGGGGGGGGGARGMQPTDPLTR